MCYNKIHETGDDTGSDNTARNSYPATFSLLLNLFCLVFVLHRFLLSCMIWIPLGKKAGETLNEG